MSLSQIRRKNLIISKNKYFRFAHFDKNWRNHRKLKKKQKYSNSSADSCALLAPRSSLYVRTIFLHLHWRVASVYCRWFLFEELKKNSSKNDAINFFSNKY